MSGLRRLARVCAFAMAFASAAGAQQPRDSAAPPATAAISGLVVVDDASARPLRRATVTLSAPELRGTRTTSSDDAGRFTFAALPAGRYSLSAQRPGYLRTQYGAARVGQSSTQPIALADGQHLSGLTIKLARGAVMTGAVTDAAGRPVSGVSMALLQYRFVNGERVLGTASVSAGGGSPTDDRGIYRIYGLPPGEYLLAAQPPMNAMNDVRVMRPADIEWAQQQVQRASPAAVAPTGPTTPAPVPSAPIAFAPIYYPGAADPRTALSVKLSVGEERAGLDFSLPLVRTGKIAGTVLDPAGRPAREVIVSLLRDAQPQGMGSIVSARTMPDGTFTLGGVPPGHYILSARTNPQPPPPAPPAAVSGAVPAPPERPESTWAMTEIDVDGNDVAGLSLTLQPGMTASARVAFDATTAAAPDPANVRLLLTPAAPSQSLPITASTGTAQPDGTWLFKNLVPATYRLIANISPGRGAVANVGWTIKSVIVNGRPATDLPLSIRPGESTALTITFSDKAAEIAGRLMSASGQPASEYAIVVFTADQTYWGLQSRRTAQIRPQPDGSYRVANLPPGDYYLAAVAGFDPADLANPGFFDQLVAASVRITLAEGEKKTQDLRLAGG